MIKIKRKSLIILVFSVILASCSQPSIFSEYKSVDVKGWDKDSSCVFDVSIENATTVYDVFINVRNVGEYPHQNLWLFIQKTAPDSTISNDTINFFLADNRGKWLGSGIGSVFEMPVLYQQKLKFDGPGKYEYKIFQGMRDSMLIGISDIGLRIEKTE